MYSCDDEYYADYSYDEYYDSSDPLDEMMPCLALQGQRPRQTSQSSQVPRQQHQSNWEINSREITLLEKLGEGFFGIVRRGKWQRKDVAVKLMKVNRMSKDEFVREARIMMSLQHLHVVKLYGVSLKSEPIYIVTEFMKYGALLIYLRENEGSLKKFKKELTTMSYQVCLGMEYLERQNFIHRDLAARNCLVGANNCVKVGDFGLSRYAPDDIYSGHSRSVFAGKWAPPEVLRHRLFSNKSDVWSFGILMWEIFTYGDVPYGHMDNMEVASKVIKGFRLARPQGCPKKVYEVMEWCWEADQNERPSFKQLIRVFRQDLN